MKTNHRVHNFGMSGHIKAPQYGLPRMKIREIQETKNKITPVQIQELARLIREAK